ncbi:MAG: NHL repeat-containing protein [Bryobacteraceae bacterium]
MKRAFACMLIAGILALGPASPQAQAPGPYTISTLAGTGTPGSEGDGSPATEAQVNNPFGLALDSSGNLYIADQFNNRVRKLTPDGKLSTVAGTGKASYSGDGGSATEAALNHPCGIAIDSAGNLYIADTANNSIRKVTSAGTISTFAGTGSIGNTGDDGEATKAVLDHPIGLAVDSQGNLYIADTGNNRVRVVGTDGKITAFAGTGTAGSLGDGGPAKEAQLNRPQGVFVTPSGVVYIADTFNHRIRKVDTGGAITSVAGTGLPGYSGDGGPALKAALRYPKSVFVDRDGNLFIVDAFNARIRVVTPDGIIHTVAGDGIHGYAGDDGNALKARFRFPSAIAVDSGGRLYVTDTQNNRVRLLAPPPSIRSSPSSVRPARSRDR